MPKKNPKYHKKAAIHFARVYIGLGTIHSIAAQHFYNRTKSFCKSAAKAEAKRSDTAKTKAEIELDSQYIFKEIWGYAIELGPLKLPPDQID